MRGREREIERERERERERQRERQRQIIKGKERGEIDEDEVGEVASPHWPL